jgi:uncharacterized protein YjlB
MTPVGDTSGLRLERFEDDGSFPNSGQPLLFYAHALRPDEVTPETLESLFAGNGWPPAWRSSIYTFHHYHSTAHEVLGIATGGARLMLGGRQGREFDVAAGDVIVIPAGVAHRRLSSDPGFLVVGGYPPGQTWDLLRGEAGERPQADRNIASVPRPDTDPVAGPEGPLTRYWR